MATKAEIKEAILKASGNPESGVVFKNVDAWADAIVALDAPTKPTEKVEEKSKPTKETRTLSAEETR